MSDLIFNDGSTIITGLGGVGRKFTNDTGAPSIKGTSVDSSANVDRAFTVEDTDAVDSFGVVYEDGVADGEECFVITSGNAEFLLEDGTSSTRGNWVKASDVQAGRVDATNLTPPGGTITEIQEHFQEVGHCLESKSSGTNVLCLIAIHHN